MPEGLCPRRWTDWLSGLGGGHRDRRRGAEGKRGGKGDDEVGAEAEEDEDAEEAEAKKEAPKRRRTPTATTPRAIPCACTSARWGRSRC